ncbi:MAG: hypothetical protein MJ207_03260 [Bacilli bacterium]|nr:hypothetical protein [Bacilli bacterium]
MSKIIEGHTFDEYQDKYGKKFENGKLEFVPLSKDNQLDNDKNYWKIDDKKPGYYEITNKKPLIFFLAILGAVGTVTAIIVTSVMLTKPTPIGDFCQFTFDSEHSQIDVDGKKHHKIDISLKKGEKPDEIYYVYADEGYELETDPELPDIIDYEITDGTKAKLSFNSPIVENITVTMPTTPAVDKVQFHFLGNNCKIDVDGKLEQEHTFELEKGKKPTEPYNIKADTNYDLPETITDKPDIIDYSRDTSDITKATISFNSAITDNTEVTVKADPQLVTFHFTGTNCKIKINEDYLTDYTFSLEKGKKPTETYNIKANNGFVLPAEPILPSIITYTKIDDTNATLVFNSVINNNIKVDSIKATPPEIKKWYTFNNWWDYCSCNIEGVEADDEDIGQTVQLKVNNQNHDVRLIGLDHDDEVDGDGKIIGKVHTTFQFNNLLCDENGYSFGVVEDFDQVYEAYNADYLNSILRKDLTGNGAGEIMWFQRGEVNRSDKYKTTTVMDMLPKELKKVLKEVKKEIYVGDTEEYDEFIKTDYCDKLFVPTYREMFKEGSEYDGDYYSDEGTTYEYYLLDDSTRIFNQISTDIFVDPPTIWDVFLEYGADAPENWAGYCSGDHATDACAVFASPDCSLSFQSVLYIYSSTILPMPTTTYALGITPCFCI